MPLMPKVICPHCQQAGKVTVRQVKRQKKTSFLKVVAQVGTMGALAPMGVSKGGLKLNACKCGNCGMSWES